MTGVIEMPYGVMGWIFLALRVVAVLWALGGVLICARTPAGAFVAEGKWSRTGWLCVCAGAAGLFLLTGPVHFFGIIGVVAVGVFYADVRPAVAPARR